VPRLANAEFSRMLTMPLCRASEYAVDACASVQSLADLGLGQFSM
jgi:hypothetical protein